VSAAVPAHENPPPEVLAKLLTEARTIAVVGASSRPERPSHGVMMKLLGAGYRVIPVNPNETAVLGCVAYPTLLSVPEPVDIVNVFRRPEHAPAIADEAASIGAKALWLQVGVVNEEAAARAARHGLLVVMDDCIGVTHALLRIPPRTGVTRPSP
jgi:predicted CoA-binding protein